MLHRVCVVQSHVAQAAIKRCLIGFFEQHGNTGVGKGHGNSGAHGPSADNRCRMNRQQHHN